MDAKKLAVQIASLRLIVFFLDCTGSMGGAIKQIIETLTYLMKLFGFLGIEFLLVCYGDYEERRRTIEDVVNVFYSSPSIFKSDVVLPRNFFPIKKFLDMRTVLSFLGGGGDCPEALRSALYVFYKLQPSLAIYPREIMVFVASDASPHGDPSISRMKCIHEDDGRNAEFEKNYFATIPNAPLFAQLIDELTKKSKFAFVSSFVPSDVVFGIRTVPPNLHKQLYGSAMTYGGVDSPISKLLATMISFISSSCIENLPLSSNSYTPNGEICKTHEIDFKVSPANAFEFLDGFQKLATLNPRIFIEVAPLISPYYFRALSMIKNKDQMKVIDNGIFINKMEAANVPSKVIELFKNSKYGEAVGLDQQDAPYVAISPEAVAALLSVIGPNDFMKFCLGMSNRSAKTERAIRDAIRSMHITQTIRNPCVSLAAVMEQPTWLMSLCLCKDGKASMFNNMPPYFALMLWAYSPVPEIRELAARIITSDDFMPYLIEGNLASLPPSFGNVSFVETLFEIARNILPRAKAMVLENIIRILRLGVLQQQKEIVLEKHNAEPTPHARASSVPRIPMSWCPVLGKWFPSALFIQITRDAAIVLINGFYREHLPRADGYYDHAVDLLSELADDAAVKVSTYATGRYFEVKSFEGELFDESTSRLDQFYTRNVFATDAPPQPDNLLAGSIVFVPMQNIAKFGPKTRCCTNKECNILYFIHDATTNITPKCPNCRGTVHGTRPVEKIEAFPHTMPCCNTRFLWGSSIDPVQLQYTPEGFTAPVCAFCEKCNTITVKKQQLPLLSLFANQDDCKASIAAHFGVPVEVISLLVQQGAGGSLYKVLSQPIGSTTDNKLRPLMFGVFPEKVAFAPRAVPYKEMVCTKAVVVELLTFLDENAMHPCITCFDHKPMHLLFLTCTPCGAFNCIDCMRGFNAQLETKGTNLSPWMACCSLCRRLFGKKAVSAFHRKMCPPEIPREHFILPMLSLWKMLMNEKKTTPPTHKFNPEARMHFFCTGCNKIESVEKPDGACAAADVDDGPAGLTCESCTVAMPAEVRYCLHCAVPIIKNNGCNKMHCSHCEWSFCWLCAAHLPGGDPNDVEPRVVDGQIVASPRDGDIYAHLTAHHGGYFDQNYVEEDDDDDQNYYDYY